MNTTEKFIEKVTVLLGREAVKHSQSDTDRNRCKIPMEQFTGHLYISRYGLYTFELWFEGPLLLRCLSSVDLALLCTAVNEYLSTLQKALEPNERNSSRP